MSGSSPSSASVRNNTRETREARAFAQLGVLLFRVVSSDMISHGQVKYSIVSVSLVFGWREGKGANNLQARASEVKPGKKKGIDFHATATVVPQYLYKYTTNPDSPTMVLTPSMQHTSRKMEGLSG